MLKVGKQQNGVILGRWLLRGPRAVDEHDSRENAKAADVKQSRVVGTTTTSVSYVADRNTSSGTAPKACTARRGKASMARPTARPLDSSSSRQAVLLSIPGARQPVWPLRLPPLELVLARPPKRRWLRRANLLRLNHLGGMTATTCTFACRGKGWRQLIMGSPRRCSTRCLRALGHRMQCQFFTSLRCSCRHPRRSSHVVIPAPLHTRVSRSNSRVKVVIPAWIRWRPNRTRRP